MWRLPAANNRIPHQTGFNNKKFDIPHNRKLSGSMVQSQFSQLHQRPIYFPLLCGLLSTMLKHTGADFPMVMKYVILLLATVSPTQVTCLHTQTKNIYWRNVMSRLGGKNIWNQPKGDRVFLLRNCNIEQEKKKQTNMAMNHQVM